MLHKICKPTLLLNTDIALNNLEKMFRKAKENGLDFRPHFKTHQSLQIGRWFKSFGVDKITVSSLTMAAYFAEDGWKDITVAIPINIREIDLINKLAQKIQLNILLESKDVAHSLGLLLKHPVGVYIKIDTGYGRTGISWDNNLEINPILAYLEEVKSINFIGFLCHAGHSYKAKSKEEVLQIHESSCDRMKKLKSQYVERYPFIKLSVGDTPTCSLAVSWEGIDEIRPGNFIFYDLMQWQIGSNNIADIAVQLVCPVIAKHADRLEIVVHGGAVHLSKDAILLNGNTCFGLATIISDLDETLLVDPSNYVKSLSQEHGILKVTKAFFEAVQIGDLIGILPIHSCLTAECMGQYFDKSGNSYDHLQENKKNISLI